MKKQCAMLFAALSLGGAEYTLSPGEEAAAVMNKLQPGDTLIVKKGVHRPLKQPLKVKGTPENPVVIRGEDPDLSIFSAWSANTRLQWEPVEGARFVWKAPFPEPAVWAAETDSGMLLQPAPTAEQMPRYRGTFFYDKKAKELYIHSSNGKKPTDALRVSIHSGHLMPIIKAENVILRDLTFLGSAHQTPRLSALGSAIRTQYTKNITIDNCRFLFNSGGVNITNSCLDSVVRNSFFRKNISLGYSEMAQLFFGSHCKKSLAENNLIVDGQTHGLRFYSGAEDCTARGNIVVNEMMGIYYKASRAPRLAERNVAVECSSFNYSDESGGRPIRDIGNTFENPSSVFDPNPTNLIFNPKRNPRFCAPEFYDFRLQSDSPCLGRGAFPGKAPVVYLSPDGGDAADGGCEKNAVKTPARAVSLCPANGTLYAAKGNYGVIAIDKPLTLRGRGGNPEAVFALIEVKSPGVVLENLKAEKIIASKAKQLSCRRVEAKQITAAESPEMEFYRCAIAERKLELPLKREVFSTAEAGHCIPAGPENKVLPVPVPEAEELKITSLFPDSASFSFVTPALSSDAWRVRDSWWTFRPVAAILEYGETEKCENRTPSLGELFHYVNLSGLKPGTRYFYRVRVPEKPYGLPHTGKLQPYPVPKNFTVWNKGLTTPVGSFVTPTETKVAPRILRVVPGGLTKASEDARPGDTLLLAPGVYQETFMPRVSGRPGAPITLKSEKPGAAVLDGANYQIPAGVYLDGVSEIVIDGITFRNFGNKLSSNRAGMEYGQMQIVRSRNIEIRNCRFFGQGIYQQLINMKRSGDIRIVNNFFSDGVNGIGGGGELGNILIERNTFYAPAIRNIALLYFAPEAKVTIQNNLFLGQSEQKARAGVSMGNLEGVKPENIIFDCNVWYFSPENPIRYCGFEKPVQLTKEDAPAGLARLRKARGFELNGREISSFKLKNGIFVDPIDAKRYHKEIAVPIEKGMLPEPGAFDPDPALGLDRAGKGGTPAGARGV